eukprot:TRINITY_DN27_c0_g1_i2.p3 TRINITY_DN27_c0_g1~~TRINITY_DN27_c0_g1_i2.p3  ORF type:complete len:110 (-),score=24.61 TRINITY_DN27_c0_g1_i2:5-334(-)
MLGKFSWEEEPDGSLDLSAGESVFLVVSDQSGGLKSSSFKDIVDERVHDAHGSLGDSSLWVDLLEHSVDVDGESLSPLLLVDLLFDLSVLLDGLLGWGSFSNSLLGGHV